LAGSKRSLRRYLRALLVLDEPLERTAGTYALGVFLGFSPLVGMHTLIALAITFLFRVNRLAILLGVYTNTPWTYPATLTVGTALGMWILRIDAAVPTLPKEAFWTGRAREVLLGNVWELLAPFLVGNFLLAAAASLTAFVVSKSLLGRYRARRDGGAPPPIPAAPDR
jgi:uncharacterized protein (DUF2062 family)